MRTQLIAICLLLSPSAAFAQFGGNPGDNQQGGFNRGDRGDGGFRRMGPPPNPMFTAIDVDGDGTITKVELRKAVAALKGLDTDGDGNITVAEASPASPWGDPDQFVERMIKENDANGDGSLSVDEVPERMRRMLEDADQNGDGQYSRDELKLGMESMRDRFRRGGRDRDRGDRGGFAGGQGGVNGGGDGNTEPAGRLMQLDRDGNGLSPNEIPQNMRGMFRPTDDLNGDGVLNAAELQAVTRRMGGAAQGINPVGDPNTFRDPNRRNRQPPGAGN